MNAAYHYVSPCSLVANGSPKPVGKVQSLRGMPKKGKDMKTTEEIKSILKKQGYIEYLESNCFAITPTEWCEECNTHKHICGHDIAIVLFNK